MCVNAPMCSKRFPLHALLVTTLKSHMCQQQSGCALWLYSLLRFLRFGFQGISQSFILHFLLLLILHRKEFLITETFCTYILCME